MGKAVYCIARTVAQAETIVEQLRVAGFSNNDISALFPDKSSTKDFAHEKHTQAPEGATTGGAVGIGIGAVLGGLGGGAVLGWLAGIGSLAIPGVGPFIAAGPIMGALGGAAVGGVTGGFIAALVGMGMPEYEAMRYEGKLRGGNILVSVHTDDAGERTRAKEIFKQANAEDISTTGEANV